MFLSNARGGRLGEDRCPAPRRLCCLLSVIVIVTGAPSESMTRMRLRLSRVGYIVSAVEFSIPLYRESLRDVGGPCFRGNWT